jgi:lipid-A-disaccharide synthase-like uncharacterized protein
VGAMLTSDHLWMALGLLGGAIFQGRFYLQWIVSELQKKSIVPIAFWYMSSIGTVILMVYAIHRREPVAILGNGLNTVIYTRNLIHIWRNQGQLSPALSALVHIGTAIVSLISLGFVYWVWAQRLGQTEPAHDRYWFWVAVGVGGQALFGLRFFVQWIATERARKSVIPTPFWYISICASLLLCASFTQNREWILALVQAVGIPIYFRNLWFIHRNSDGTPGETVEPV